MDAQEKLDKLLNSTSVSQSLIAGATGIPQSKLSRIKHGNISVDNMAYDNAFKLLNFYDKLQLLLDNDFIFDQLLEKNHYIVFGDHLYEEGHHKEEAIIATTTIDEFSNHLREKFPDINEHNKRIINYWHQIISPFENGYQILEDDFPEYINEFVNKYDKHIYYNKPEIDSHGKWHISLITEFDIISAVKTFHDYNF